MWELSDDVEELKLKFDALVRKLAECPPSQSQNHSEFAIEVAELVRELSLRATRACTTDAGALLVTPQSFLSLSDSLRELLLNSECARHAYLKPLGYAGDYQLIECLYDGVAKGNGSLQHVVDYAVLNLPAAEAVRNRREFLTRCFRHRVVHSDEPVSRFLSLACGPAREVLDFMSDEGIRSPCEFHLVDIDQRALSYVKQQAANRHISDGLHFHHHDINHLVLDEKLGAMLPKFDMVYSIGLTDYFQRRHVVRLINFAKRVLKPGGELILGNFHPRNPDRALMDFVVEWKLIHRDESEMHMLCRQSQYGRDFDRIDFEPTGINLFATVLHR